MKKILIFLFAFLITFSVSAQFDFDDIQWGVVGGLNYAVPVGEDIEDYKDDFDDMIDSYDNQGDAEGGIYGKLGFHLGVTAEYDLKNNLSIVSGLQYSQKGFRVKQEYKYTIYDNWYGVSLDNEGEGKARFILDYLDLPITVKYNLDNGFSVFGGILFSFLIAEKVKSEYEESSQSIGNYGNIITYSDSDSETDDFDDIFDEGDPEGTLSGYQIGIGYEFDTFNVSLKLNKNSNAFETPYGDDNQNITYQLSVGRYF